MDGKGHRYSAVLLALAGFVALCAVSAYALRATSSTAFCMSCHEMQPYRTELQASSHAKDTNGTPIDCRQCHIPAGAGPRFLAVKIYSGVKDVAVHFLQRPDTLDRVHAQQAARRFVDDANCLACHGDLYTNAKGDAPVSEFGKLAHDAYLGKNGNTRQGCAGCHVNLAHLPEFDRRLPGNASFASRLPQGEGKR